MAAVTLEQFAQLIEQVRAQNVTIYSLRPNLNEAGKRVIEMGKDKKKGTMNKHIQFGKDRCQLKYLVSII